MKVDNVSFCILNGKPNGKKSLKEIGESVFAVVLRKTLWFIINNTI